MAKQKAETSIEVSDYSNLNLITQPSVADIQSRLKRGKMVASVLSLNEGDAFEGRLVGPGASIETTEEDAAGDTQVKLLKTWRFDHDSGVTVDLISAHQLDKNLPELVGKLVFIQKQAKKQVGKKQVNQFAIIDMEP